MNLSSPPSASRPDTGADDQQLFQAVFDASPAALVLVDSAARVLRVNAAFDQLMPSKTPLESLPLGHAVRCIQRLADPRGCGNGAACQQCPIRVLVLQTVASRVRCVKVPVTMRVDDDPAPRSFLLSAAPVTAGVSAVLLTFDDITEIRRTHDALAASEAKLRQAQRLARMGHYDFDIVADHWAASPALEELFGISPDYVRNAEGWLALVHPDQRADMRDYLAGTILRDRMPFDREYMIVRPANGETRWVHGAGELELDPAGRPLRLFGVIQDISRRKGAGDTIREINQRLALATASAGLGVWDWDLATNIVVWDDRMYEIHGVPRTSEPRLYEQWCNLLHPADRQRVLQCVQAAVTQGVPYNAEFRIIRPDGAVRDIRANGTRISDAAGQTVRFVGINHDITDIIRARQDAARHQAATAHLARLNTMGQMASGLAHELYQPLTAILGYAQYCKDISHAEGPAPMPLDEALDELAREALRASNIIQSLRGFLQKQPPARASNNINRLIQESFTLLAHVLRESRVDPVLALAENLPDISFDGVQVEQVIINLLQNALDAMADTPAARRLLQVATAFTPEAVVVTVTDSGPGIPADQLQTIFDEFQSTKPLGLGLGLAISKRIIESHGGRLTAANNTPHGARFTFTLPLEPPL